MSSLPAINTISNGSPADASEVNDNFTTIKDYIDGELIERDGSTPMTGELTLSSSAPSGALVAASKGYVDAQVGPLKTPAVIARSSNLSIPSSANVVMTFTTESNDTDGWWSSGGTFTCPADGLYHIAFWFQVNVAAGTSVRMVMTYLTGTEFFDSYTASIILTQNASHSSFLYLKAGSTFNFQADPTAFAAGTNNVTAAKVFITKMATGI